MKQKNFVWRFTLVNRFTLERIDEVICFGCSLFNAEKHLRSLFPKQLYDVEDCCQVRNSSFIMVGMSNFKNVLSYE